MFWSRLFKLFFVVRNENIILHPLVEACWIIHHRCLGSRKINLLRRRMRIFNKVTQNIVKFEYFDFLVYFYWKKDIGIGILKSIKNKIITFKLFQERQHKINQRQERAQRFKICGSFVHFTIIFVLYKKYLKLLTIRIKKFLNHQSIGDRFSKKEDTRTTSAGGANTKDLPLTHSIALPIANRLQHNRIQNASLSTWALCPEKAEAISGVR